ncbi:MAG TPA: hypothetical protein VGZ22_22405 [Isosphaeraceae bacterium]|jgi:hypothetical protein|nr:hypothetical protein [Isosphaeraceae bacterium]
MSRPLIRSLASLALACGLGLCAGPARAQNPNANDSIAADQAAADEAAKGSGFKSDSLYGYVATGFLAAGVMFVVCKSARR